jgi:HAD superfamily hydrolase (TIGR01493 family)
VSVITFDLNGTLLDPGDQADVLQRAVQMSMAHTLAGEFRPFAELIAAAGGALPDAMPPFPDVTLGLERLAAAGHRLNVITNSATETGERHLRRAGLRERFEHVAGTDQAGAYKPDPRVYGLIPGDWHVAAHWWDILGAGAAGRRTVCVARREPLPPNVEADIVVGRLDELELE